MAVDPLLFRRAAAAAGFFSSPPSGECDETSDGRVWRRDGEIGGDRPPCPLYTRFFPAAGIRSFVTSCERREWVRRPAHPSEENGETW